MTTITLRQGHATPKTIILYPLPVAAVSAGTTIRLYAGHATPSTIILGDPTQPRPGGSVTRSFSLSATDPQDVAAVTVQIGDEFALAATDAVDTAEFTVDVTPSVSVETPQGGSAKRRYRTSDEGKLVVPAGQSLSDAQILNMNYLVQGVQGRVTR